MKKVTTTVAVALVALSFAACNKTNSSVTPEEGSASGSYASLTVSTNALPSLKADPDPNQKDEGGRAAESKIASMDLIGNITKSFTLANAEDFNAAGSFWQDADKVTYRTLTGVVTHDEGLDGTIHNRVGEMIQIDLTGSIGRLRLQLGTLSYKALGYDTLDIEGEDIFVLSTGLGARLLLGDIALDGHLLAGGGHRKLLIRRECFDVIDGSGEGAIGGNLEGCCRWQIEVTLIQDNGDVLTLIVPLPGRSLPPRVRTSPLS